MDLEGLKYLVVGSGFFGSVIAERIANDLNEKVLVIDSRDHIGGNSYSYRDANTGIDVHKYGSHIFHTPNRVVWDYLNKFTSFNNYRHKVLTRHQQSLYQMPVNLKTINDYYKKDLQPCEVMDFLKSEIEKAGIGTPRNLEEQAISMIGRPLYEAFIKGYTLKQWETDPLLLPSNIITRLPFRTNYDPWYFDDPYQGIPEDGYGAIFDKMLKHRNIFVQLSTDFFSIKNDLSSETRIIYSGPLDKFFDYNCGTLGWRTLDFETETLPLADYQGTAVLNYADIDVPYTRVHEYKHYTPERKNSLNGTIVSREFSRFATAADTPYYPINTEKDKKVFASYLEQMKLHPQVIFGGRLGSYKYMDMHHVIASALKTYERRIKNKLLD